MGEASHTLQPINGELKVNIQLFNYFKVFNFNKVGMHSIFASVINLNLGLYHFTYEVGTEYVPIAGSESKTITSRY